MKVGRGGVLVVRRRVAPVEIVSVERQCGFGVSRVWSVLFC